jgi:hypothetical protein
MNNDRRTEDEQAGYWCRGFDGNSHEVGGKNENAIVFGNRERLRSNSRETLEGAQLSQ